MKTFKDYMVENIPMHTDLDKQAHLNASTSPLSDLPIPSLSDMKKGNYEKSEIGIQGMRIIIENPYGSVRKGINQNGEHWSTTLTDNYGEIHGTIGADGDFLDIFVKPHMTQKDADKLTLIFVVDQVDPITHEFDEHKVVLGYDNVEEARRAYLANYQPAWTGLGAIVPLSIGMFKYWINNEDVSKPLIWGK